LRELAAVTDGAAGAIEISCRAPHRRSQPPGGLSYGSGTAAANDLATATTNAT